MNKNPSFVDSLLINDHEKIKEFNLVIGSLRMEDLTKIDAERPLFDIRRRFGIPHGIDFHLTQHSEIFDVRVRGYQWAEWEPQRMKTSPIEWILISLAAIILGAAIAYVIFVFPPIAYLLANVQFSWLIPIIFSVLAFFLLFRREQKSNKAADGSFYYEPRS